MNKTSIEWTDFSSNPLYVVDKETGKRGWFCEKVSPGCAHCYASALNVRRGTGHAYLPENRDKVEWRLNERELEAILRRRKPARIFMCDMTDLFHEDVPDEFIERVFLTMALAERHTFQVLTKRPQRMRALLNDSGTRNFIVNRTMALRVEGHRKRGWEGPMPFDYPSWPLPNVWLGVSVENQRMADERIPVLLETPAAVRFLSCEPLLGPPNLRKWLMPGGIQAGTRYENPALAKALAQRWAGWHGIDWVIAGGESGPGRAERKLVEPCCRKGSPFGPGQVVSDGVYRPRETLCEPYNAGECDLSDWRPKPQALVWLRRIRDDCQAAGVAFHLKQLGGPRPTSGGRLLDGREWDEMPEAAP